MNVNSKHLKPKIHKGFQKMLSTYVGTKFPRLCRNVPGMPGSLRHRIDVHAKVCVRPDIHVITERLKPDIHEEKAAESKPRR